MEASPGFTPLSGTCLKCYSSSCFLSSKLVSEAFQTTLATCTHRNEPIADLSLDDTHINTLGATWVDRQMQRHSRKTSKEHFQDRRKELCSSWICRKLEHLFQVKGWKWLSFQWKVVLQLCKDKQRGVFIWAGTSVSFLGVIFEELAPLECHIFWCFGGADLSILSMRQHKATLHGFSWLIRYGVRQNSQVTALPYSASRRHFMGIALGFHMQHPWVLTLPQIF